MYGVYYKGRIILGRNDQALLFSDEITAIVVCARIIRDREIECTVEFVEIKVL